MLRVVRGLPIVVRCRSLLCVVVCCVLLAVCCWLVVVCCLFVCHKGSVLSFVVVCGVLFDVCVRVSCALFVVRCLLIGVRCWLFVVGCSLFVVRCSWLLVRCVLRGAWCWLLFFCFGVAYC